MATAVVIENDRINITAPDRTAVIQQTLPLGGLRPQRRSRFAEPFADGAPKSTEKQSATDRLMAGTTIMGDSLRTTRTANHLTSDPAFDNAGWKTPSVNRNLPSHEATDQIDQQSNDAAVSSRVLDRKEISAKAANVQSVEPNVPVVGVTSTTVSNASPVAAIRTETPSSTGPSTLPETLDLRQSNWGRALGHQLNWMVNHRMQEAEIRVNPPQLGPLEVRMSLHQNQTSVTFFCHDAAVREAIESAIPRLREMLDSQGIFLNQAQVSDQSLARQQAGSGEQSSHNPRDGRPSASHQPDPELPSQETKSRPRPNLPGTVDDYA
ncbi:MAG TPA: flagellar hook-length control protein FliK [Candidatus Competibacteraceae bacterium]|nr:flagellar hook-length control protein FliK [Candidatus Competibacteraceae bacterium]